MLVAYKGQVLDETSTHKFTHTITSRQHLFQYGIGVLFILKNIFIKRKDEYYAIT